jgi:hypothetical protein
MTDIETEAFGVYDGDKIAAVVKSSEDADALLNETMEKLSTPDEGMELVSSKFTNELSIQPVNVLLTSVQSNTEAGKMMTEGGELRIDHIVEENETLESIAAKFGVDLMTMTGFLDGINDSLKEANRIEEMEEDTPVNLGFDTEKLYKNMVAAGANWLYDLPEWKPIYSEEKRHELYLEQKKSGTVVKEKKIYPNDPCPCGSGKKYKKCHGRL